MSLDELAFHPTNVKKHGLTYTALSRICTKEKLYLLAPLQHSNFHVESPVIEEMKRLKLTTSRELQVLRLKTLRNSHVIIQALNTNSLREH